MTDPKTPAFPRSYVADGHNGMTLRDYFAGQALAGSLAGAPGSHLSPNRLAPDCYAIADAMLAERDRA